MEHSKSKFNFLGFNNVFGGSVEYLKTDISESVDVSISSVHGHAYVNSIMTNKFASELEAIDVRAINCELNAFVEQESKIDFDFIMKPLFNVSFNSDLVLGSDYYAVLSYENSVEWDALLGADHRIRNLKPLTEKAEKSLKLGSNEYVKRSFVGAFSGITSLESTEEFICYLDLVLQPGERLVIDSDNYNVFIGTENYIHAHSGDWVNELKRETVSISLEGGNSNSMSASILYTERYL